VADGCQYLVFSIGADEHAVPAAHVREIVAFSPLTRIPGMPAWIRGVSNLRGHVLPVIDLATRFGGTGAVIGKRTCVVVIELALEGEPIVLGLLVDAVSRVIDVVPADIEPAPSFGGMLRVDFVRGMVRAGTRYTVLLELDRVFSPDEILDVAQRRALAAPTRTTGDPPRFVMFED